MIPPPGPGANSLAVLYEDDLPRSGAAPQPESRHDFLIGLASGLGSRGSRLASLDEVLTARRESGLFGEATMGRDGPVHGTTLGPIASQRFDAADWQPVEHEFEEFVASVNRETRRVKNLISATFRVLGRDGNPPRHWAALAAAGAMVPWLRAMPFEEGNLWCAELHCYSTLVRFDIPLRPGGLANCRSFVKHSYAAAVFRAVRHQPSPSAVEVWLESCPETEGVLSRHDHQATVADLALALVLVQPGRGF